MKIVYTALALLLVPTGAFAANHARISPEELVFAIREADPVQLEGVDPATITTSSVRVVRCVGPDEEPTEFECVWQARGEKGWIKHKNWLAVDGSGWHFID